MLQRVLTRLDASQIILPQAYTAFRAHLKTLTFHCLVLHSLLSVNASVLLEALRGNALHVEESQVAEPHEECALLDLPTELLERILSYLAPATVEAR